MKDVSYGKVIGVGMTDKYIFAADRPMWNAAYETQKAASALLIQDTLDTHGHGQWKGRLNDAIEHLTRAAKALGYDMVPRLTPQQAHEAAIARRRREEPGESGDIPVTKSLPVQRLVPRHVDPDSPETDLTMGR